MVGVSGLKEHAMEYVKLLLRDPGWGTAGARERECVEEEVQQAGRIAARSS
jgi:hypothetical protein